MLESCCAGHLPTAAMAGCSVVAECMTAGATDGQTLATVLLTLTLSTLIVGVAIVIVGEAPDVCP